MSDGAPIVVGALGGSGTRVAAQALIDSGAYLGSTFNRAHDNLVFTALFKRPQWLARAGDPAVHRQLDTFVRHMQGRRYGPGDYGRLASSLVGHDPEVDLRESGEEFTPEQLAAVESFGFEVR